MFQNCFITIITFTVCCLSVVNPSIQVADETTCAGYNACHTVYQNKLNVHLVPYYHADVGWIKTPDQYFYEKVQYIISSVITYLQENPARRFIQVETAFFHMWWKLQTDETRSKAIELIDKGQLEIANGAWTINDETSTHYQSIIDQFTLGYRFLEDAVGKCARPKVAWRIGPDGYSREQTSLLSQIGVDAIFVDNIDYRDKSDRRFKGTMEMLWRGSSSLGNDSAIFTSVLQNHDFPSGFCFDVNCNEVEITSIVTDPDSPEYNWEAITLQFAEYVEEEASFYHMNNILVTAGGDLAWRNSKQVFDNIDKLLEGIRKFKPTLNDGREINVIYSTPACYVKAVNFFMELNNVTLSVKTDDFVPYSDGMYSFLTGLFTSRPTSKRLERQANNLHQVSKQVAAFGANPYGAVSDLSRALGIFQHHNAITGTEREAVKNAYHKMIVAGMEAAISKVSDSFASILGAANPLNLKSCLLSNVSICEESNKDQFNVLVYNPLARNVSHYVQIPVNDGTWKVTDPTGKEVANQLTDPVRSFDTAANYTNSTSLPKVLFFKAENLPAVGYRVYTFQRTNTTSIAVKAKAVTADPIGFEDRYVSFNPDTGILKSITLNGFTLGVRQALLYYRGENDSSGAYTFRPEAEAVKFDDVQTDVLIDDGELVREVRQVWTNWTSQIIRIYKDEDFIEFDWVVGPIDTQDQVGKEVISRYSTDLYPNNTFYTDSNGREMIYRKKNHRETYQYTEEDPQSGNYFPVNTRILVKDDKYEFAVLPDRSEGGSSLSTGEIELMLHRVTTGDDHHGLDQNLDEIEYFQPVIARGSHFVTLGTSSIGNDGRTMAAVERDIAQRKHLQPWLFYTTEDVPVKELSFLNKELPPNIHLLTLESWNDTNSFLIRLEHILEEGEDPNLSKEVTVDLQDLFKTVKIRSMVEYMLAANTPLEESKRFDWAQMEDNLDPSSPLRKENRLGRDPTDLKIALAPMQIRTFVADVEIQSLHN
ncbi:hypothetical protein NQ315_006254 [Exocentrus adspersus]|uniref:Alpha-mannosidase n=1 Tax=Exocentrus adspersus TaxID=1586481 RepID=A0AAV8VZG9_9CUCU|nr:hypothetical protein NQ315_006254 [Exocentrus adspersus]